MHQPIRMNSDLFRRLNLCHAPSPPSHCYDLCQSKASSSPSGCCVDISPIPHPHQEIKPLPRPLTPTPTSTISASEKRVHHLPDGLLVKSSYPGRIFPIPEEFSRVWNQRIFPDLFNFVFRYFLDLRTFAFFLVLSRFLSRAFCISLSCLLLFTRIYSPQLRKKQKVRKIPQQKSEKISAINP